MKEQIINFETAKLAKEKGCILIEHVEIYASFSRSSYATDFCNNYQNKLAEDSFKIIQMSSAIEDDYSCFITLKDFDSLPTQSLLQKWLRDTHRIDVLMGLNLNNNYSCHIYKHRHSINENKNIWEGEGIVPNGEDYELVFEEGLQEGLKLI